MRFTNTVKPRCPFCEHISDIVDCILDAENPEEIFDLLHDEFTEICNDFYKDGYKKAFTDQAQALLSVVDKMDDDCDCEDCHGNCCGNCE